MATTYLTQDLPDVESRRHAILDPIHPLHNEKRDMTLCIAAECRWNQPCIVMVADTQGTDFAKSTDVQKIRGIRGTGMAVMFCDSVSSSLELMSLLEPTLQAFDADMGNVSEADADLRVTKLMSDIGRLTAKLRAEKQADYVMRNFALDMKDFYVVADAQMRHEAAQVRLNCELLIGHASASLATIIYLDREGVPCWINNYHCMGSGAVIARSMLSQEDWHPALSPMAASVRLLVAKKCAERDPYVGDKTQMVVVMPGKPIQIFTDDGLKYLNDVTPKFFNYPATIEDGLWFYKDSKFY